MSDPTTRPLPGGPIATIRAGIDNVFDPVVEADAIAALDLLSELVRAAQLGHHEPMFHPGRCFCGLDLKDCRTYRALLPFETSTEEE